MAKKKEFTFLGVSGLTIGLGVIGVILLFVPFDGPFGEIAFGLAATISAVADIQQASR